MGLDDETQGKPGKPGKPGGYGVGGAGGVGGQGGAGQPTGGPGGVGGAGGEASTMPRRRRRSDRWRAIAVAGALLACLSILLTAWLYARIEAEGAERRDQSCTQNERRHADEVARLQRTYDFLERLPRSEWGTNLTRAIVRQLPETERSARASTAPAFCDEPGIGLPERDEVRDPRDATGDPKLPEPQDFSHLLERP